MCIGPFAPDVPTPPKVPPPPEIEEPTGPTAGQQAATRRRRRLATAQGGRGSTALTSPLGVEGGGPGFKTVLGA